MKREYDIIIWGATGFTGGLVAEYLTRQRGLKWAIGGRSADKLAAVLGGLKAIDGSVSEPGIVVADSTDEASLAAMCARTRVVASTVGPFSSYGAPLVAACVAHGTHYCDITGEPQFVRRMIDLHHDAAVAAAVRIVHCCGFDSIPSDLGTLCAQVHAGERDGVPAPRVSTEVRRLKGEASGGTIASIGQVMDEARADPEIRKIAGSPYSLNPPDKRKGPRADMQVGMRKSPSGWTAPFLMAGINIKVVHRSHALLHPDAPHLEYTEVSAFGGGAKGLRRAAAGTAMFAGVGLALGVPALRNLLVSRVLPAPGEGPTREQIAAGGFEIVVTAHAVGGDVTCTVIGVQDPGYGETSKMLSEAAMCLLEKPGAGVAAGGVLTPATGLGMPLVERLRDAGMRFDVSL